MEASERTEVTDGSGWQTGASGLLLSGVLLRIFFTFQFARASMLASSPIRVRELEQWAWMADLWVLADASDISKSSDLLHILSKADELSARLTTFAEDLRRRPGLLVSQTLRQEVYQLLLRFTTVRVRLSQTSSRQASAYRACGTCTRNSPSSAASTLPNAPPYLGS
jgi:hypothetical protein